MKEQKIQHRLGNYEVLGLLSYGSTSNVFKVRELPKNQNFIIQTQKSSKYELITIDMSYYHSSQDKNKQYQQNKKDWILKLYNLERMVNKQNQFLEEVKYDILVQIIFLTYLNHPGIVKAKQMILQYEYLESKQLNQKPRKKLIKAGIVMQICQKGCFNSLLNYINRTKALKQNKIKIMKYYLSQIANTLKYLNDQCKILHRDIKAQNIMVNKQLDIKVIDYGISRINIQYLQKLFQHKQKSKILELFGFNKDITCKQLYGKIKQYQSKRKNLIGSKHYISPQLVQKYRSDMELVQQAYFKTDIWSFGVLVYKIFHDKYPFQGRNLRQTLDMIVDWNEQYQINKQLPQQVVEVIQKCLKKDYSERISWIQLIKLKFFNEIDNTQVFNRISPIIQIMQQNRKQKQTILQNANKIHYDEKMIVKYDIEGNKRRRVMIIRQKKSENIKILILKEKQSISNQILIENKNNIKITKQQNYLQFVYSNKQNNKTIKISNQSGKQSIQRFIQVLYQAINYQSQNNQGINNENNQNYCKNVVNSNENQLNQTNNQSKNHNNLTCTQNIQKSP